MIGRFSFLVTFLAIAIAAGFTWFGCKSNSKSDCLTCKSAPPPINKDFKIGNNMFKLGVYQKTSLENFTLAKVTDESNESADKMKAVIRELDTDNEFETLLNEGYLPVCYKIFVKNSVKILSKIGKDDIPVISIILYKNNGLHHFLFKKSLDNKFRIDSTYSATTDDLYLSDGYRLFHSAVAKPESKELYSLISIVTPDYSRVKGNVRSHNALRLILDNSIGYASRMFGEGSEYCDANICVPIQDSPGECVELVGGYGCKETRDDKCTASHTSKQEDVKDEIGDYPRMAGILYTMRDSILDNSTHGQEIVSNYYLAGQYVVPNLNHINVPRLWGFIKVLSQKTEFVLNNQTSSTVVLDSTLAADCIDFIDNDLRPLSTDQQWQDCCNWMKGLVTTYTGASADDVYKYITS